MAEVLLRLQFLRGLRDADIRTRILQDRKILTFNELFDTAKAVELSKTENAIINQDRVEHDTSLHLYKLKQTSSSGTSRKEYPGTCLPLSP
ncbi:hypothetical protein, partial [Klebsiella pneumoniae]|uniref:hypothetical protein n=2 Tax=Klebsiella pneumoniae TaxID=573 RepID=UPI0040558FEF